MTESTFLKALFDGMRCGILCIDCRGRLLVVNDLAIQVLGLTSAPESGVTLDEAFATHPALVRLLTESFGVSQLPSREELTLGDDSNPGKTIGYTLSYVSHDGGDPAGIAMFFRDLTLIEKKEEQVRLKDRLAALGQMAASLAHEIRNPLASINVTCSLLRRRLDDEENRKQLDKITAEVNRLNRTITSSLEFVRPVSLCLALSELDPVLESAIEVASGRHNSSTVMIVTDFSELVPKIEIDREQLRQVFENLVLNAVEAVGADGVVEIETRLIEASSTSGFEGGSVSSPQRLVEIQIADNGPGLTGEDRQKVFYPFFTTKEQGSGIGLSMAKKIVDCHHGHIDVKNRENGGAIFTVRLPITQS